MVWTGIQVTLRHLRIYVLKMFAHPPLEEARKVLIVGVFSSLLLPFILQFVGCFFTEYYEQTCQQESQYCTHHAICPFQYFTSTLYSLFTTSCSHRFHWLSLPQPNTHNLSLSRTPICLPLAHSRLPLYPRHHNCHPPTSTLRLATHYTIHPPPGSTIYITIPHLP